MHPKPQCVHTNRRWRRPVCPDLERVQLNLFGEDFYTLWPVQLNHSTLGGAGGASARTVSWCLSPSGGGE